MPSQPKARAKAQGPKPTRLHEKLLAWYDQHRRDLPWRRTRDPYAIWLSEVMLQQTRVETVIPYYARFLEMFPSIVALAEAPTERVLAQWSGLGYYRRARMLHEAAKQIALAGGQFPSTAEALEQIKGIGRYTAGAVASIAFGEKAALVDGNVARVFARLFAIDEDVRAPRGLKKIWAIAESTLSTTRPGDWNQSLMELGATICVPRDPRCLLCPVASECRAKQEGRERELPILRPKVKPTPARRVAFAASKKGKVLLARRRSEGLFGGMWEPPSIAAAAEESAKPGKRHPLERLAAHFEGALTLGEHQGRVVHVLSHRRLTIDVWSATCTSTDRLLELLREEYDDVAFVDWKKLSERGTTTLAHKILATGFPR